MEISLRNKKAGVFFRQISNIPAVLEWKYKKIFNAIFLKAVYRLYHSGSAEIKWIFFVFSLPKKERDHCKYRDSDGEEKEWGVSPIGKNQVAQAKS